MRTSSLLLATLFFASAAYPADAPAPVPYPTLNPPDKLAAWQTRSPHYKAKQVPPAKRTAEEQAAYEARVDWFHKAKYGVSFHFLAGISGNKSPQWTSEKWNAVVNAIDVEKVADQAKEIGAGYVVLTIGQNCRYHCAPNPVIEKHWHLKPGEYGSTRDLPMDLHAALKKRGIPLMLYMATDNQYKLPRPPEMEGNARFEHWLEAMQWYSDHYGAKCAGWWIDGLYANTGPKDYTERVHAALRHGNPDGLLASGTYGLSDFTHGHANMGSWDSQRKFMLPYFGRWDPEYKIQWHVFQYLGPTWAAAGIGRSEAQMREYFEKVIKGGGVITFDLGTFPNQKDDVVPRLEIPKEQMALLRTLRDALKKIPASDGSGK